MRESSPSFFFVLALAVGCGGPPRHPGSDDVPDAGTEPDASNCDDADGDGFGEGCAAGVDCDDTNPAWTLECPDCEGEPTYEGCPCAAAEPEPCYSGPPEAIGTGPCMGGLRSCADGRWTACEGEVLPSDETLHGSNGVDDDCNGLFDDGLCGEADACAGSCCTAEQICFGAFCAVPPPCASDAECTDDAHCVDGACRPWGDGESSDACEGEPLDPHDLGPEVACHWDGGQPWVTPLVVDLDGGEPGEETPEIVFTAWGDGLSVLFGGGLIVLDGRDCTERFVKNDPEVDMSSPVAVGDIDGDGDLEIAARTPGRDFWDYGGLAIFDDEGNLVCESSMYGVGEDGSTPLAIANLDGVGDAEIVMGMKAYDSSCQQIWSRRPDLWPLGSPLSIADVDLDGELEVVTGTRVLQGSDGAIEAQFDALDDGYTAVADFDPSTPEPEIAVVAPSGVRIQTFDGTVVFGPWDVVPSDVWFGGPPTVADFDGDGQVELATGGSASLTILDPDCEDGWDRGGACDGGSDGVLWQRTTESRMRGATSASALDLNGDGSLELFFTDECFLRAHDGANGDTLFAIANQSGMAFESPTPADADGDGIADLVVSSGGTGPYCGAPDAETGTPYEAVDPGVRVFHHVDEHWARARAMWNQHAYSVTNVEDDGTIPDAPALPWETDGLNGFRLNQGEPGVPGPDLTVRGTPTESSCPGSITLRAIVANRGAWHVDAGVSVEIFAGDPDLGAPLVCDTVTGGALEPGESETVSCDWIDPPTIPTDVVVVVDRADAIAECLDENARATIPRVHCPGIE